jgi:hypothetical protein
MTSKTLSGDAAHTSPTLKLYFSCPKFSVKLTCVGDTITEAAPFVKKFEGQKLANLVSWTKSTFGGQIVIHVLDEIKKPSLVVLLDRIIQEYKDFENVKRTHKPPRHL